MRPSEPSSGDKTQEVSALSETLFQTRQRLEELTASHMDKAADPDGRILLLWEGQQQLSQNQDARQAAILNALSGHIALLDTKRTIVSVNDAWQRFSSENVIQGSGSEISLNYLEICDRARGDGSSEAHMVAEGIRSVLDSRERSFSVEYPCHSPTEQRWFQLRVTPSRRNGWSAR
jgi:PAS domain-containing protein